MEAKGIKETKEALTLVCKAIAVGKEANADGKIGISDLPLLVKLYPAALAAFAGGDQIPAELKDLDSAEGAEIVAHVMAELTLDNAKARAVVQAGLKVLASGYELVQALAIQPVPAQA